MNEELSPIHNQDPTEAAVAYVNAITAIYNVRAEIGQMGLSDLEVAYDAVLSRAVTTQAELRGTDSGTDPDGFRRLASQRLALHVVASDVAANIERLDPHRLPQLVSGAKERYGESVEEDVMFPWVRPSRQQI